MFCITRIIISCFIYSCNIVDCRTLVSFYVLCFFVIQLFESFSSYLSICLILPFFIMLYTFRWRVVCISCAHILFVTASFRMSCVFHFLFVALLCWVKYSHSWRVCLANRTVHIMPSCRMWIWKQRSVHRSNVGSGEGEWWVPSVVGSPLVWHGRCRGRRLGRAVEPWPRRRPWRTAGRILSLHYRRELQDRSALEWKPHPWRLDWDARYVSSLLGRLCE